MSNTNGEIISVYVDDEKLSEIQEPKDLPIGETWCAEVDFQSNGIKFEYYMRRGNNLYFRNGVFNLKVTQDDEFIEKWDYSYGDILEIEL